MIQEGMTIREAAERWVGEMNAIPQDMIGALMANDPDSWHEVTRPRIGDRVYVYSLPEGFEGDECNGELENYLEKADVYLVNLDDGTAIEVGRDDFEVTYDDILPMWGTMWSFGDSIDDYWLSGEFSDEDGLQLMSECGFRIFEHDEWGYFFGIDGAGYSFYEEHWIPLYKARGLHWHDEATETQEEAS